MRLGELGESGAGKSTLMALAPRLYDVPEGTDASGNSWGAVSFDGQRALDRHLPGRTCLIVSHKVALVPPLGPDRRAGGRPLDRARDPRRGSSRWAVIMPTPTTNKPRHLSPPACLPCHEKALTRYISPGPRWSPMVRNQRHNADRRKRFNFNKLGSFMRHWSSWAT